MNRWTKIGDGLEVARTEDSLRVRGYDATVAAMLVAFGGVTLAYGAPLWILNLRAWAVVLVAIPIGWIVARGATFEVRLTPTEIRLRRKWFGVPYAFHRAPLDRAEIELMVRGDHGSFGLWPMRRNAHIYDPLPPGAKGEFNYKAWDFGAERSATRIVATLAPDYLRWTRTDAERGVDYPTFLARLGFESADASLSRRRLAFVIRSGDYAGTPAAVLEVNRESGLFHLTRYDGRRGITGKVQEFAADAPQPWSATMRIGFGFHARPPVPTSRSSIR